MALINEETDKFMNYRYSISEFTIITDKNIEVQPFQIVDISIENNFESDLFPLFKVSLIIDPPTYYSIIKNKNTVKFKIRIQKYSQPILSNEKSLKTDYINDTFSIFLDDSDEQFDENIYKKRQSTDGYKDDEVSLFEYSNKIDLYLFKDIYVTNINKTVNKIVVSSNLTTVLAWLLSQGGLTNALVSPLDNRNTYSPLILPPQNVMKTIRYLDNQYGFYKNGALIFFGVDRPYILNYKGGCTAWVTDEWKETNMLISTQGGEYGESTGALIRGEEKKFYINLKDRDIRITNNSIVNNVLGGTNAYTIDGFNDSNSESASTANVKDSNMQHIIVNDWQNKFLGTTFAAQNSANSVVISTTVSDINIEALAPNKQVSFIFEDTKLTQKYKGIYRISSSFIKFTKDGEDFSTDVSCSFKKVG